MSTATVSLEELEPSYQIIAAALDGLIAKEGCLDGLYSVGILLQYIAALKAQASGPFAQDNERVFKQLQLDYFAMKERAHKAEYAAADHVKTEANIALATAEKYSEFRKHTAAIIQSKEADNAAHKENNQKTERHYQTIIERKHEENKALKAQNTGLKDELAEQEKQMFTLIRELEASEKYRRLLTKAILHSTNTPTEPAV